MKTTLKNAFNDWNDDLIDISTNTLCEDTGISSDSIKLSVLSQLALNKKKKIFGRSFKFTVIAATLATALIIGTTAINANGGVQLVLEEFFGGNMNSAGLYDGGDVKITSLDPNLDIEFLGVTGDERNVYAVIEIFKKDNTAFTDGGYINPTMSADNRGQQEFINSIQKNPPETPDELISKMNTFYGIRAVCRDRNGNNFGFGDNGNAGIIPKYYLSDDRKILKILVHLDMQSASGTKHLDARDGTMTIISTSFSALKNIQTIAAYDKDDQNMWSEETFKAFQEKCREMNIGDTDWRTLYTPDKMIRCVVDEKQYPLPFEITFTMNYRNNGNIKKSLHHSDAPHFIEKNTKTVDMTVSAFQIYIYGHSDDVYKQRLFQPIDMKNSKVIFNDGTELYLEGTQGSGSGGPASGEVHDSVILSYRTMPDLTYYLEDTLIDTREIKQIIINGDTVYSR